MPNLPLFTLALMDRFGGWSVRLPKHPGQCVCRTSQSVRRKCQTSQVKPSRAVELKFLRDLHLNRTQILNKDPRSYNWASPLSLFTKQSATTAVTPAPGPDTLTIHRGRFGHRTLWLEFIASIAKFVGKMCDSSQL